MSFRFSRSPVPSTTIPVETPVRPGRPRSLAADEAIRDATLELLATEGYANLTMSGVAAQAGVSTATLYRRWTSKLDLVIAVLQARAEERPVPDTGSLRGDCRAILRDVVEASQTTNAGPILPGLVGEIGRNPELAEALRTNLIAPRRAAFVQVLERAAARGELRAGLDHELVIDLLIGPLYHRLLMTGAPVDDRAADALARLVIRAIAKEVR
ncbi:MAG: TetR/AcrR family transcriptional regulator [Actinobacteria bacterium]|nr:MAG: TetR/AcrR family transcriptional regulator [Actinomycetota bacterium]